MKKSTSEIPVSWQVQGSLSDIESSTPASLEDLYSVRTPGGELTLDVGWDSPGSPTGKFVCSLVADDDWVAPMDVLTTNDSALVRAWVEATLLDMHELRGTESTHPVQPIAYQIAGDMMGVPAPDRVPRAA